MFEIQQIAEMLKQVLIEINVAKKLIQKSDRPFLTIDEASEYLGISKATLYGYTSKGIIPFYKLQDRKLYFKIDDLDNWILRKENRYKSINEIRAEAEKRKVGIR